MADRYFHVDVSFMHKNTAKRLREKFGGDGVLAFLALVAQAKNGRPPGTFEYENEDLAWRYLGFDTRPDFGFEEFLDFTGKLKQTARRRQTGCKHVAITQYGRWQKDAKRLQNAERQRRHRAKNRDEASVTGNALRGVTEASPRTRTRTRTTPRYADAEPKGSWCTEGCGQLAPGISLNDHLRNTHGLDV